MYSSVIPFHASTIKNMSRATVDRYQILRINFFTPGQGKGADDFPMTSETRIFFKELSFRSLSKDNLDSVFRIFKEVQKRMKQREMEGYIERGPSTDTESLKPMRSFPCIRDVHMRPTFGAQSRRTIGTLEAHSNGFRFSIKSGSEKIDILYSKVKHAIFVPCESISLIVMIHLNLKEPIMIGRKRTQDVQFLTEVAALTEDLSQRKAGSAYDPDEIMEEQREREMKERLNRIFKEFTQKTQAIDTCKLEFDIPYRALQFTGVPNKGSVELCPCSNVLVSLEEWPPFCMDLSEIDIVVFERCLMSLREFDIVFVKKDYNQMPLRITTIPHQHLDKIKCWLHEMQLVWYTCTMNMQWANVMKEITRDVGAFIEGSGWDAWFGENEQSDGSEEGAEKDGESDWEEEPEDEDDDDGNDDDGSDFDAVDDEEESASADDGDEDGMSWDELEAEADRADRKRGGAKESPEPQRASKRRRT